MACRSRAILLAAVAALFAIFLRCPIVASEEISVSFPSKLQIGPGGDAAACNRVRVRGLSRLRSPSKVAHSVKLQVSLPPAGGIIRSPSIQLCFHRNASLGECECPVSWWQKLSKGSWTQMASPYGDMFIDLQIPPDFPLLVEVSTEEEFFAHRVVFFIVGMVMMMMARVLSGSIVFYYGSAMSIGVILVVLVILFQGMKLLPTGRRRSLAILLYSSIIGLSTIILQYLSGLLQLVLINLGISEDIHNPIGVFLLLCIILVGAWCGFRGVRKLVLTEDGLVDSHVAYFVEWAIWIFSTAMILQCSLDMLLAVEALIFVVVVSVAARVHLNLKAFQRLFKKTRRIISNAHLFPETEVSRSRDKDSKLAQLTPSGSCRKLPAARHLEADTYFSSFHDTPDRGRFSESEEEWGKFTREQTSRALKELVSSPDFGKWAVANAERLTLTPLQRDRDRSKERRRRFYWF